MADLSLVTDNYFATASETFADNLSGSIAAGAATVPVNSAVEYATGDVVVLTVEPGTANEATFIGEKDTGNQFINCIWTEGNIAVGHDAGATIIDYDSATHFNAMSKGIRQFANQDGSLKTQPVRDALALGTSAVNGWEVFPYTMQVSSGYNKGTKEYEITVPNQDASSIIAPGTKIRLQRGTTAPTQCMSLASASAQYASRASASLSGPITTITDDYTIEFWLKPASYQGSPIPSRLFGRMNSGYTNGFATTMDSQGRILVEGYGTGNRVCTSRSGIPIGVWTHVAASLDMSAGSAVIYFNGISVTLDVSGSASAFIQPTGDLIIGTYTGGAQYYDGKISDVRMWNVVRTQTQIRDNMHQQLVGSETNLIAYYKLNGNLNDSTSYANHLTGSGGAVATNADNPMNSTEYAVVHKVTYSAPNTIINVFTGHQYGIPNMTLSAPYYSTQDQPYGFPDKSNFQLETFYWGTQFAQGSPATNTWYNPFSPQILTPTGKGYVRCSSPIQANGSAGTVVAYGTLSKSASIETHKHITGAGEGSGGVTSHGFQYEAEVPTDNTSQTTWYPLVKGSVTSPSFIGFRTELAPLRLIYRSAWV